MSSLRRGHANFLCMVSILVYVLPKRALLDCFFKRVDRIEFSKEPEPVPSMSGVNQIAACPLSPIADDPLALPSPTSSLSSSQ